MRAKTSISLPQDLVDTIDELAGENDSSRSKFIETAIRAYVAQTLRERQNARDLDILNQRADALNEEARDVLSYQVVP